MKTNGESLFQEAVSPTTVGKRKNLKITMRPMRLGLWNTRTLCRQGIKSSWWERSTSITSTCAGYVRPISLVRRLRRLKASYFLTLEYTTSTDMVSGSPRARARASLMSTKGYWKRGFIRNRQRSQSLYPTLQLKMQRVMWKILSMKSYRMSLMVYQGTTLN